MTHRPGRGRGADRSLRYTAAHYTALESMHAIGISRELIRQDLDGNFPLQLCVGRAVYLAHSTCPTTRGDYSNPRPGQSRSEMPSRDSNESLSPAALGARLNFVEHSPGTAAPIWLDISHGRVSNERNFAPTLPKGDIDMKAMSKDRFTELLSSCSSDRRDLTSDKIGGQGPIF
jgi:hypothetical protein